MRCSTGSRRGCARSVTLTPIQPRVSREPAALARQVREQRAAQRAIARAVGGERRGAAARTHLLGDAALVQRAHEAHQLAHAARGGGRAIRARAVEVDHEHLGLAAARAQAAGS